MPSDDLKRLTFDAVDGLLPKLDELRPLRASLLADARSAPGRAWSGSGVLETAGGWMTDAVTLLGRVETLAADEARHTAEVFRLVAEALTRLEAGHPADAARLFLEAAGLEERRERADRAAAYADTAVRLTPGGLAPEVRGRALRCRGRARRALARTGEALADYTAAWDVALASRDAPGGAEAAVGAGNALEDQARWVEAEIWYRRALELLDEEDPESLHPPRLHALFNLHVVRRSLGDLAASIPLLEQAERVAEAAGDESAHPFIENARGQLCMAEGDVEGALSHFRYALVTARGARARVTIRLNLAEALLAGGRGLDAAEEARRAEAEAISGLVLDRLPEACRLLGRVAAHEGNPDAFVLFERALTLITQEGLPDIERARTLQAYAEAETKVGDAERARELRAAAEEIYTELGIGHARNTWVDRHGPAEPVTGHETS